MFDKKGRICEQDAVINASIWLGVTISQQILYKIFHPKLKVGIKFLELVQSTYIASILKFGDVIFDILRHGTFYNLLQMDQYGLYIDLCLLVRRITTDNYFVYDSCYAPMGGNSGDIYCVTLIDNRTYAPMIILKKGTR